jgi:glycosyl transferase, family 25
MLCVDQVITISLVHRSDRRDSINKELAALLLKTDFYLAHPDKENRERGCFNSHLTVCKNALALGLENVLVLEDDAKINHVTPAQITRINHFIKQHADQFDILYLGLIIGDMWFTRYPSIARARGAGAHAYILSKRGMQKLSTYTYQGIPIDKVMKREFKCYSVYPMIAEQYPETQVLSDISCDRANAPLKNELFWQTNRRKQRYLPWMNLHKFVVELFSSN